MEELIERLEKAARGSRDLDAWVWKTVHDGLHIESVMADCLPGVCVAVDGTPVVAEPVTTSLDAIVGLIGEKLPGWYFGLQENRWPQEPESTTRRWSAYVNAPLGSEIEGTHRDRYIACCIALLRAQSKEADHDQ